MMQRLFFICSPRLPSHLACPQYVSHVEWPYMYHSQLPLNFIPNSRPYHQDLLHWVDGRHHHNRSTGCETQLQQSTQDFLPPTEDLGLNAAPGNLQHMTMSASSKRSRRRSERESQSKMQRTQDREPCSKSGSRSKEGTSTSQGGFTQGNWPKSTQECQWRRAGKEFKSAPSTSATTANSCHNQRSNKTDSSGSTLPYQTIPTLTHDRPSAAVQKYLPQTNFANLDGGNLFSRTLKDVGRQPNQSLHSSATSSQGQPPRKEYSEKKHAKRSWVNVQQGSGHQTKQQPFEFSVVSYNVLAQGLLQTNSYLYEHCRQDVLPWEYRRRNLLEEIKESDADVICLQEVESDHFHDFFKPQLAFLGYAAIYKKRTGDKQDGCATFFKTKRFKKVFHSQLEYQRWSGCLDRDNVAIIVMLQPRGLPPTHQLCVANTHLLWNPRRGDVKLAQLGLLFADLENLSHVNSPDSVLDNIYHPIVLCGDFNSLPHCPLYKFVKKGHMNYSGMSMVDVSGQLEGSSKRAYMPSPLWPKEIGITQRCRYVHRDVTAGRANTVNLNNKASRSDRHNVPPDSQNNPPPGSLIHPFFFSSAYEHNQGNQEITTNHSRTNCTVDYIFYTRDIPQRYNRGGAGGESQQPGYSSNLTVKRRLSLFTDNEVRSMGGLPNTRWSSDHLSLQARFSMTPIFR